MRIKKFNEMVIENVGNNIDQDVLIHKVLGIEHKMDPDNIILTTYLIENDIITNYDKIMDNFHDLMWDENNSAELKKDNLNDLYDLLLKLIEKGANINYIEKTSGYSLLNYFSDIDDSLLKWNFISLLLYNGFELNDNIIRKMDDFENKKSTLHYIKNEFPNIWSKAQASIFNL